jgi:LysM repeat protein
MRKGPPFSLAVILVLAVPVPSMAAPSDLEQEYAQVRKIALKDPKVQDAFEKANQRLDERILQIDPALKPIVDKHAAAPVVVETQTRGSEHHPAASPAPEGRQHVVIKGETLSSIAGRYKVKVVALEKINHITDDRKLRVGQKLVIPAAESLEEQPATESPEPPPKDNGSLWDRLKSGL